MGLGYDMAYAAAAVAASPLWGYRLLRTGKWRTDWPGRFGHGDTIEHDHRQTLLIHAVSVGEVNAISKLVDVLHTQTGETLRIVVSVTTDTGTARARQLFEPAHRVVRFPLDFGRCVRRFLDRVNPQLVALTELEVWPNFVSECAPRGVPVCVINGRLSARSFRRYRWLTALIRPAFAKLTTVAAQTDEYAPRFVALGTPPDRVRVLDSMKWDTADVVDGPTVKSVPGAAALARAMGIDRNRPVIVAGSTGPGEEALLIDQCPADAQLVLVPRKPERFGEVAALAPGMPRRSHHGDTAPPLPPSQNRRTFLLDTMGELRKAYALADVAIVGRSFLGQYGSNPMEPIALAKPTIIGPHYGDFADMVDAFHKAGGIQITDRPGQAAAALLADPEKAQALAQRGMEVILSRQGATQRHADMLLEMMPDRAKIEIKA